VIIQRRQRFTIAARLQTLAVPGGICIAGTAFDHALQKLDVGFEHIGEQHVKNIADPVRVYRVLLEPKAASHVVRAAAAWRGWAIAAAAAVLMVPATAAATLWLREPPAGPPAVAVLPFDNLRDDPKQTYFADGIEVFAYKGRQVDVHEVARELGVRYLVDSSVRRAGDRVRVNGELIDSETGGHLWADHFDRNAADMFVVQDEVIHHIVEALAVQLSAPERDRLNRPPTTNLEAYDYFLRAEQAARTGFPPKLREALRLYEKAVTLDPAFAEAYAADARTAAEVIRNNYDEVLAGPVARKRAYEHAGRALQLAPEAPLPFAVLAILQSVDGRHDEGLASAERAVALGPSDAEAHAALSFVLTFTGRHAEAVAAIETALRLNPSLPTGDRIVAGLALLLNGEPERALEILEPASAEAPDVDTIYVLLAAAYAQVGRPDTARRAAAEAVRLGPLNSVELYGVVYANFRRSEDLAQILDALRAGGLPEWPYGFRPDGYERLSGTEIGRLAFGRTWQGRLEGGKPALARIQPDGQLAFRTTTSMATGAAYVDGDMLCERFAALFLGRPVCGPVYRRAERSGQDDLAYSYFNASKVFHFSPVE
jgi:TolB-like protein/Flp pilus assembly protein TadD